MMVISVTSKLPSLEELLFRRGIHKSREFDDYQDYIEQKQRKGLKPKLLRISGIFAQDMHLGLGKTVSVERFWTRGDK